MTASDWGPDSPADDARDAAELPPSSSMAARTPVPEGDGTPEERTDDLSPEPVAALVALARVLDPDACDPPATSLPIGEAAEVWRRQDAALLTARRVWEACWRLVSEDDATVTAVGQAIMHALARVAGEDYDSPKAAWSEVGRAAVRALREAGSDA